MLTQQLRGLRLQLDRRVAEMVLQPRLAISRAADRDVDDLSGRRDGLDDRGRHRAAAADQDQDRRGQGVLDHVDQAGRIGGEEPAGISHDDHALIDEERRREAGIHHGTDVDVVPRTAADLLHHQRVVAVPHHFGQQRAHLLGHQRRVVALDQIRRMALTCGLRGLMRRRSRRPRHRGRGRCP